MTDQSNTPMKDIIHELYLSELRRFHECRNGPISEQQLKKRRDVCIQLRIWKEELDRAPTI